MIDISQLQQKDIGKWVRYTAHHGAIEDGRIKSWNEKFIFVVYKCNNEWDRFKDFTGQATSPEDLQYLSDCCGEVVTYDHSGAICSKCKESI